MNLQGGVVDRWRGDGGTSYASPPVVCVALNVRDWGWLSEMDNWRGGNSSGPCPQGNDDRSAALAPSLEQYNTQRRHTALGGLPPTSRLSPTLWPGTARGPYVQLAGSLNLISQFSGLRAIHAPVAGTPDGHQGARTVTRFLP